ncbi:ATP-dependent helicase [Deinococcus sp. RIT780]|uniref:ATP-dependent helicase n=1 Tax=Deinococcus sp. RIT780 TaxID=2870472 RepID=UPI001C8AD87A|nr:ATP-dependent helicase [Deinococcus sp. RIT780]MBX8464911.1 ATP-dependent helicase [Deinococcus sp. RIT780]
MDWTLEQQQIVQHGDGHALVFAVAGSGKTTTLVGRIRHLIGERNVRPARILATTFTREARRSLEEKLAGFPECAGVTVVTLHALATRVVDRARQLGFTEWVIGEEHFSHRLFSEARKLLLAEQPDPDLAARLRQLTYQDFSTYLGIQKGNLGLPYIPADLPPDAARLIHPPEGGPDAYARLYSLHDELRRREGKLDFDDLIVAAWILMNRFPALLQDQRSRWDYVHIDEFQDVNLAQSEMMHLIAAQANSYMAIGDDDQTIYQWRGAHPRFILGFTKRYGAKVFSLPSNFRCPLGVIALADRVIAQNRVREPKRLRATRGGNGVQVHPPAAGQGARVAIQAIREGRNPEDIVILLRTYAQSAEIEQVFLQEKVPYRLIGAAPFYRRSEVTVLTAYIELALADLDVLAGEVLTPARRERLQKLWRMVANRPSRYLRTADIEATIRHAWRAEQTLARVVEAHAAAQPDHVRQPLTRLATWLEFLTEDIGTAPGRDVLLDFVSAVGYREYLVSSAPTEEFGQERAASIDALAEMAQTRSLGALITHLAELQEQVQYEEALRRRGEQDVPRVTLMTAFRAKGLEWPVVIVPDCVASIYSNKPSADAASSEEERRVFYVALTRAQEELHLVIGGDDTTPFLHQVDYETVVGQHDRLSLLLSQDPGSWSGSETVEAAQVIGQYEHEAFVQRWLAPERRVRVLGRMVALGGELRTWQESAEMRSVVQAVSLARYAQHGPVDVAPLGGQFGPLDGLFSRRVPGSAPASPRPDATRDALGRSAPRQMLAVGDRVRHARAGDGEVLEVRVVGGQPEALIRFPGETKRIALNFSHLKKL